MWTSFETMKWLAKECFKIEIKDWQKTAWFIKNMNTLKWWQRLQKIMMNIVVKDTTLRLVS